jgi:hypothetical protein
MKISSKYRNAVLMYLIVGLIALIGGYFINTNIKNHRNDIINGIHEFTIGQYKRVGMVGTGSDLYIEIRYEVDGKIHDKTVSSDYYYTLCNQNKSCKNKQFWVMYLVKDPAKSLVDISKEIQNIKDPQIPMNFENFR